MKPYKKCKYCGSEFVCWGWIHSPTFRTYWGNLINGNSNIWRRPWMFITGRWMHECWNCNHCFETMFKVRTGMPYDVLTTTFVYLPKHELRDNIEELNYLFYDGYKMWVAKCLQQRLDLALASIKTVIETQFKEKK